MGNDSALPVGAPPSFPRPLQPSGRNDPAANHACQPDPPVMISYRRRRRRHYERNSNITINVGFLNLNGARKASKWAELYTAMSSEAITVFAVAETHLRNLEEPPVQSGWQWAGCNRTGESRRGGGVGVIWGNGSTWVPMAGSCEEHMWISGSIVGIPVLVGVVYLTVVRGQHDGNDRVIQCIIEDVKRWTPQYEILLLGDFNGHIQCIDGYQNRNGELMIRCTRELSLEVVSLRADCEGEFTWCARNSRTTIDYALVSSKLGAHIAQMHIDEDGHFSLGSDDNRLRLSFSASAWRHREVERRDPARRYRPTRSYETVAEQFEQSEMRNRATTYDAFIEAMRHIMRQHEVRTSSRGGTQRKPWWDQEVKQALEARRRANRTHRTAVKLSSAEDCRSAWEEYLRCKHYMQEVVQRKIAEHNHRQLQTITRVGRDRGRRFWSYVRTLEHKPSRHDLRDETTGLAVTDLPRHLTRHVQAVYDQPTGASLEKPAANHPAPSSSPTDLPWHVVVADLALLKKSSV
ncbi:hypothetical protein HPB52_001620 [Rhipicephalus sanguineus]|uniref:Endonuclease/exonuclease/phosphatase domain-containing protein n=1 Tax=Rhipicephalus sanguineus TaxID=34632 RepID=A0A9D4PKZ6_RHISA|nr:hypothetical protein HPB52_001620 [Rhipicephalus sanguineus]